jgi:hypothetical protein
MFVDTRALDIDVNVHHMGKSWSQIHSEPSLTCEPVDSLDFKDMVYVNGAGWDTSKCCLPVSSEPLPASALTAMRQHFPCEEECYDVNFVIGKLGSLVTGTDSTAPVRPLHVLLPALISYAFASYVLPAYSLSFLVSHFHACSVAFTPADSFSHPPARFHGPAHSFSCPPTHFRAH